uniref:rRNA methylase n=1 Tax=Bursaphelenchus xylophilus TaxID=6326 RepID=A0A1I7SHX4_BURXY
MFRTVNIISEWEEGVGRNDHISQLRQPFLPLLSAERLDSLAEVGVPAVFVVGDPGDQLINRVRLLGTFDVRLPWQVEDLGMLAEPPAMDLDHNYVIVVLREKG